MFRLTRWKASARKMGLKTRRQFQANLEVIEDRTLLSTLSTAVTFDVGGSKVGQEVVVPVTAGWSFTTNNPIAIERLGVFDYNGDGLREPHQVAIWDSPTHILVQAAVGTSAALDNDFRYVTVPSTALEAHHTYVIAFDLNLSPGEEIVTIAANFQTDHSITYVRGLKERREQVQPLTFPTVIGVPGSYFGPNFQFTTAPDLAATSLTWNTQH